MSADAYHVIQPHPEGTGLTAAATAALRMAGTSPDQIDYVNAHGTATALNDIAETKALRRIFGGHANTVAISSTKSTTGHTLEAAGAVETVITLLALCDGVLPPTVGDDEPDPECDLDYVPNHPRHIQARRALTLNAAFGGLNAVVVLERT
jgi:3-oxoacyl-[acyl-carrier-protein] synthase II